MTPLPGWVWPGRILRGTVPTTNTNKVQHLTLCLCCCSLPARPSPFLSVTLSALAGHCALLVSINGFRGLFSVFIRMSCRTRDFSPVCPVPLLMLEMHWLRLCVFDVPFSLMLDFCSSDPRLPSHVPFVLYPYVHASFCLSMLPCNWATPSPGVSRQKQDLGSLRIV